MSAGDGSSGTNGYRYAEQYTPPPARQVTDVAVERFEHIYEVDPKLMTVHVAQQLFPNWDTLRIAAGRGDHLEWMHRHWCAEVISGQELLDEIDAEPDSGSASGSTSPND